jgi:uncharacterized protein (DUF58 family)
LNLEGLLYVLGGLLFASLLFREPLLFFVALILLLIAVTVRVWERYCTTGLGYRREFAQTRAFFGEEVPLTIEISNDKPLPLAWLEVEDAVPGDRMEVLPGKPGPSHMPGRRLLSMLLSVRWYERVRRHYRVRCGARGVHLFGPAVLRSGDVFGFSTRELEFSQEDYLLVYPKVVTLEGLGFPPRDPFGEVPLRRQWLFEDPLRTVGVRDYRPGDSPRRLHWKATARSPLQQLQVKQFEPTTTYRLHVLLNVSTAAHNWAWQGYDPEVLEAAITVAASAASWAVSHGYQVGLAANAKEYHSRAALRIAPSRDPRQMMHILEALARVVPMATMPPETLVELEGHALSFGTTIVMVTAVAEQELVQQLVRLRRAGHRPVLVLVGGVHAPPAVSGIPVRQVRVEDTQ